jgi:predicted transcriptional regulator/transcriptional regulator with XRE-family HTH domain
VPKSDKPPFEPLSWSGHLGQRLRQFRLMTGISQIELASRLKMDQGALSRLEKRSDMLISTACHYLDALGASFRLDALLPAPPKAQGLASRAGEQLHLPLIGVPSAPPPRDVVLSIRPQYSGKIVKGEKTVELRRRFPADLDAGTLVLIYETSPTRAITGIAEIADILTGPPSVIWKEFSHEACIARKDFDDYFDGTKEGVAIKLRGARRLTRALELKELRERFSFAPPQSFIYASPRLREALSHEYSKILN